MARAMPEIGTCTVKVIPDLTEFKELIEACTTPLTRTETTVYEYDADGRVTRQETTVVVGKKSPVQIRITSDADDIARQIAKRFNFTHHI